MSAGAFVQSRYAAAYGAGEEIHPIRVQPETIAASIDAVDNDPPAGAVTNPISVTVSRGRRSLGLHPRTLRARITGTPPAGYAANSVISIPVLNGEMAGAAVPGATLTYLGTTWTIVGFSPEITR